MLYIVLCANLAGYIQGDKLSSQTNNFRALMQTLPDGNVYGNMFLQIEVSFKTKGMNNLKSQEYFHRLPTSVQYVAEGIFTVLRPLWHEVSGTFSAV